MRRTQHIRKANFSMKLRAHWWKLVPCNGEACWTFEDFECFSLLLSVSLARYGWWRMIWITDCSCLLACSTSRYPPEFFHCYHVATELWLANNTNNVTFLWEIVEANQKAPKWFCRCYCCFAYNTQLSERTNGEDEEQGSLVQHGRKESSRWI